MALTDLYEYYRKLEDENVVLSFNGEFTPDLLTSVLQMMEERMIELNLTTKIKKRVFNVLVESFQNLYHHVDTVTPEEFDATANKSAMVHVSYVDGKMIVRTGNYMPVKDIDALKRKLVFVNELDDRELRELYQRRLSSSRVSDKGTAGLGLIDIARKSRNKLGFDFIPVDDETCFFCLSVVIN